MVLDAGIFSWCLRFCEDALVMGDGEARKSLEVGGWVDLQSHRILEHSCHFAFIRFSNAQHNLKQNKCLSMYSTKRTHLSENIIRFIEADIWTKAKIWTIFLPSLHRSSQRTVYTLLSRAFNRLSRISLSSSVRVRFINCVIIKLFECFEIQNSWMWPKKHFRSHRQKIT